MRHAFAFVDKTLIYLKFLIFFKVWMKEAKGFSNVLAKI